MLPAPRAAGVAEKCETASSQLNAISQSAARSTHPQPEPQGPSHRPAVTPATDNLQTPPESAGHGSYQGGASPSISHQSVATVPPDPHVGSATMDRRASQAVSGGLADSMMRTVVSNGNDALNLLFDAAHHVASETDTPCSRRSENDGASHASLLGDTRHSTVGMAPASHSSTLFQQPNDFVVAANPTPEVREVWSAYRFVKMGWISADEAVTFIDAFFQNMSPLSPILDDFYANHENHYHLVTREPLLSCMILALSSRYHTLPGAGGHARGYLIHQRLWDHCEHLLMRILLGQEKSSKAKTRTLGSIEALLLLVEWQPRALYVPPGSDGWDSDFMLTAKDKRDEKGVAAENASRGRWTEDVINPAKRCERMSWMVLGCAMSLAIEIGIFDQADDAGDAIIGDYDQRLRSRRISLAKLLYFYQEQLSSRLGRSPLMSPNVSHVTTLTKTPSVVLKKSGEDWNAFVTAWTELTKLIRSISDVLFSSPAVTRHLLQSGRYISMIEHFRPLLSSWEERHLSNATPSTPLRDILFVEYQGTRIYTNSLGLQAIVERTLAESGEDPASGQFSLNITDYSFIQEVVDGCLETLKLAIRLAEKKVLTFAPLSMFLRITTASVFLLKGLGLGVSTTKLRDSLDILTRAIAALRTCQSDDLHLSSRFATLLEMYVIRLQEKFIPAARPPSYGTRPAAVDSQAPTCTDVNHTDWQTDFGSQIPNMDSMGPTNAESGIDEHWLTLPLDPSLVPFVPDDSQSFQWLGDGSLDFVWNLDN
ncbi:hypothetical protein DL768_002577 [Monosporascus sp. mg162]|nr:hypothetical protein DL768_002577 [Monosporascus sp. mg162]